MGYFTKKLIWFLLFAVAGTSYVIYRRIVSVSNKISINGLINTMRGNSAKTMEFAETLDTPYGKKTDFGSVDFEKLRAAVHAVSKIDEYTILYHAPVDSFRYLLITEVRFSDFDIGATGEATDVDKVAYHSFVLRFDPGSETLFVYSDLYNGTTSKFQKEAFSRGILGI